MTAAVKVVVKVAVGSAVVDLDLEVVDLEAAGSARPNPSESFYMSQDLHSQTRLCTCTWR